MERAPRADVLERVASSSTGATNSASARSAVRMIQAKPQISTGVTAAFTIVSRSSAKGGSHDAPLGSCSWTARNLMYASPLPLGLMPPDLALRRLPGLRKPTICTPRNFASRTLRSYTSVEDLEVGWAKMPGAKGDTAVPEGKVGRQILKINGKFTQSVEGRED